MLQAHIRQLQHDGFTTFRLDDPTPVNGLTGALLDLASTRVGSPLSGLEKLHEKVTPERLNELRLEAIRMINGNTGFRDQLLGQVAPLLESLLGPDIAVQRNIGLVISTPQDRTSRIPVHADTWVGHSKFELNLWLPLTRVQKSQSMFILPLDRFAGSELDWQQTMNDWMTAWKNDLHYVDLDPGSALLFWHHLPHGNSVNEELSTRWSLNLRFKNLFTPYGEKGLGDYFVPWKYGPLTEMVLRDGKPWA